MPLEIASPYHGCGVIAYSASDILVGEALCRDGLSVPIACLRQAPGSDDGPDDPGLLSVAVAGTLRQAARRGEALALLLSPADDPASQTRLLALDPATARVVQIAAVDRPSAHEMVDLRLRAVDALQHGLPATVLAAEGEDPLEVDDEENSMEAILASIRAVLGHTPAPAEATAAPSSDLWDLRIERETTRLSSRPSAWMRWRLLVTLARFVPLALVVGALLCPPSDPATNTLIFVLVLCGWAVDALCRWALPRRM